MRITGGRFRAWRGVRISGPGPRALAAARGFWKGIGPWRRRAYLLSGLCLYLAASAFYVLSFRTGAAPSDALVVAAPAEFGGEARRLALAFAAETGERVEILDVGGQPAEGGSAAGDLAQALISGAADVVLWEGPLPRGSRPVPGAPTLKLATLITVRFPSPEVAVTLEEARSILADLSGGGAGPWPEDDVRIIGLGDRCPERQVLAVDGVYPTLATVADGSYPLTREVRLIARRGPRGPLGLPAFLPGVRAWLDPHEPAVGRLRAWARTEGARTAVYGTSTEVTLAAAGDVWFARHVGEVIDEKGLDYPFALVKDRLSAADVTWCDLESPLGTSGSPLPGKLIWFRAKPETVECLKSAGVDVVGLANNHILDYDSPCLLETLDILDKAGLAYCGAGRNEEEARRPAIVEAGGLKIAFLAYTEYADSSLYWSFAYPRTFLAGEGVPGCNPLYLSLVEEDIARARAEADLVVVCYHWGLEDIEYPVAYHPWNDLRAIAEKTIDLGACLVIGTHPHAVQGLETYGRGLIAYSLGNFVTDQIRDTQKEGLILEATLGPTGVLGARLVPVSVEGFRPKVAEGETARALLEKVSRISAVYRSLPE